MTFFDLRTVDERWWAKYFQQSAQSNFIHKFLRQGKLQLTLGQNQNFESKRNVPLDTSSPLAAEIRL